MTASTEEEPHNQASEEKSRKGIGLRVQSLGRSASGLSLGRSTRCSNFDGDEIPLEDGLKASRRSFR
jgi:hypothetical protein